jgi:PhoH-like ATPase
MGKTILVDTNLLLDDANVIYKLSREYEKILIPLTVLKELDDKKYNPNLSYSARNAILSILQFKEEHPEKIKFHVGETEITGNDANIIEAAVANDAKLATKDISMSIIAESKDIETDLYDVVLNNLFNPYVYINHEKLYINEDVFAYAQMYGDDDYYEILNLFCEASCRNLDKDSWFFVFIEGARDRPYIYANNPIDHVFDRIDNNGAYLQFSINDIVDRTAIKARDPYQNCAIYALKEAPHALITGCWGSGKTLLGTAYTLAHSYKKTFITRAPIGINDKYDLGFLPGKKEDKMMDWLAGFMSALYYIYANTRSQMKEGIDYDYVKDIIFSDKFEVLPMNAIQGLSLLEKDILVVDEAQLISVDYMSMILSRPSESGKLILLGDLKQTYNVVKPSESGLLKLLRVLPHRSMAYVELQNSYRSDLLEVADKLQDKTIG